MRRGGDFIYRDSRDVTRIFVVRHRVRRHLFEWNFDESAEDFEAAYRLYTLPNLREGELNGSRAGLAEKAGSYPAGAAVESVVSDPDRRRTIDIRIIDELEDNAGGTRSLRAAPDNGTRPAAVQLECQRELAIFRSLRGGG